MQNVKVFVDRQTLPDDAPEQFDPEVCVLVATVVINVLHQVSINFVIWTCMVAVCARDLAWLNAICVFSS